MKILGTTAKWLFMLCMPVMLLTASIGGAANSLWLYEYGFHKYSVSRTPELAEFDLPKIAIELISYFNSDEEYISITVLKDGNPFTLFNQREVVHLRDVKGLIRLDYWVLLGTLIYVLAYASISLFWRRKRHWRRLAWGMIGGSGITLALMLALGLGTLLNFDQLFLQFHLLSFTNELWQLNLAKDYLIMLFPPGFFYNAALFCSLLTTVLTVILGGVGGWLLFISRQAAS